MKLRELAFSRAGDKGDTSLISVIVYDVKDYDRVKNDLTAEVVKKKFHQVCLGDVTRYEVPNLGAFVFRLEHALGGGVTRSLGQDLHGKALSFAMLDIDMPI